MIRLCKFIWAICIFAYFPSCVHVQNGEFTYDSPPWGEMAYKKDGNGVMITTSHTPGWVATVTALQNAITGLATAWIAGDVAKVREYSNQLTNAGLTKVQIATLNNKFKLAALAQKPTVIDATQKAVFPPIK